MSTPSDSIILYKGRATPDRKDRIVREHYPMVRSVARRITGGSNLMDDCVGEGLIGLNRAIDLYDPAQNVRFVTYAYNIVDGYIRHYLRDRSKVIREPAWIGDLRQKETRAVAALAGRAPTNAEIAAQAGIDLALYERYLLVKPQGIVSLDAMQDGDGPNRLERHTAMRIAAIEEITVPDRPNSRAAAIMVKIQGMLWRGAEAAEIARTFGLGVEETREALPQIRRMLAKRSCYWD